MNKDVITSLLKSLPIENMLWFVFGAVLLVFGIFSAVLLWHWKLYSTGKFTTVSNMFVYLGVSAGLFTVMAFSIIWLSFV